MMIIVAFTLVSVYIAVANTNDVGTIRSGFWAGTAFAVVYLLSVVANSLQRLELESDE